MANSKIFLTPIRPAVLTNNPNGVEGSFYFNHGDKNFRFYDGTSWQKFGTGSGGGSSVIYIDGGNAYTVFVGFLDGGNA